MFPGTNEINEQNTEENKVDNGKKYKYIYWNSQNPWKIPYIIPLKEAFLSAPGTTFFPPLKPFKILILRSAKNFFRVS